MTFLCMPFLIWAAFRFGQRGTATASVLLSALAVWGTWRGFGSFPRETENRSLLLLQAFMIVTAATAMSLAAVVGERRRGHEALLRQAEELSRSNKELEQFANVASHDLQEPLRMVINYVQLMARRYRGRFDADADEFMGYAVDGALRMKRMIDDLLTLSRVGAGGAPASSCESDRALREALSNLEAAIHDAGAAVTHDLMPSVMAHPAQLRVVFQNLIGNALKFRDERRPEVHVGAAARNGEWLFSVRDNGIGISPEHTERVFVIFQRLHGRDRYPGSGIGLAICKKIVTGHGGRIWVESQPGRGATFYFTLPATAAKARVS